MSALILFITAQITQFLAVSTYINQEIALNINISMK